MTLSGHLSAQQIRGYRQRSLAAAEVVIVGDHLALCAACRKELSSADQLRRAFVALSTDLLAAANQEPAHLPPDLMAAYVDMQLDEVNRVIADSHLALCAECQTDMLDLRRLRTVLTGVPDQDEASSSPPPRRNKLATLRRWPTPWVAVQAALIVLFLVWVAIIPLRRRVTELKGQVSELQQRNNSLEEKLSSLTEPQVQAAESGRANGGSSSPSAPRVALNDGGALVTLDTQGRLVGLKPLPQPYEELVRTVLTDQRVKAPPLVAELAGKRGVLMGSAAGGEGFSLVSPLGTTLETDRPTFAWRPLSGARSYSVTIYNSASQQVAASPRISETEWTPPHPLERGSLYAWEVTAVKDGKEFIAPIPPAPQAKFKVLEETKLGELTHARQMYRGSHLILGILFAQAGLMDEAEQELKGLVAANPDSVTARNLLRSAKALRNP